MAPEVIEANTNILSFLATCSPIYRTILLKNAPKALLQAIIEIFFNVLHGNFSLSENEKKYLKQHKPTIVKIVNKSTSLSRKRYLLSKTSVLEKVLNIVLNG